MASPGSSPRPARPTTWGRSGNVRADEDVDVAGSKARQDVRERALPANGVAVEPGHASGRTKTPPLGFRALGAEAGLFEIRTGAVRTRRRHPHGEVAVMAPRAPRHALAVHDQRDAAVR